MTVGCIVGGIYASMGTTDGVRHSRVGGNPQGGGEGETRQLNLHPLSLDGRGIKGEGENDATHRHVIADLIRNPEGRRVTRAK